MTTELRRLSTGVENKIQICNLSQIFMFNEILQPHIFILSRHSSVFYLVSLIDSFDKRNIDPYLEYLWPRRGLLPHRSRRLFTVGQILSVKLSTKLSYQPQARILTGSAD